MTPIGRDRESRPIRESTGVRPEIQALRALAVTLVVVYHLWPDRLPGGYVGVDVFFAISGFLITSHLFGQVERTGSIALGRFYSRRIRRLLPASLLVLLFIGVVTLAFVPVRLWTTIGSNLLASALYVENWSLVANAVDYLGASSTTIPTQHFWSLAVEEQFYLLLPVVLIAAAFVFARRHPALRARAVVGTIAVIGIASLVYSIWATGFDQASAYFNTFTRFWEFALGGIAAVVLPRIPIRPFASVLLAWGGVVAIVATSLLFRDSSPFPGWIAALPVLATLAIIAGGDQRRTGSLSPLFRLRPVQFVGDISYSIYLWHWPLIVLVPIVFEHRITTPIRLGIIVATLALAWLSKKFVEDPLRADRLRPEGTVPRRFPVARIFVSALAAMLVVSAAGVVVLAIGQSRVDAAERTLSALPDVSTFACFGASALPETSCHDSNGLGSAVYPPPIIARNATGSEGCQQNALDTTLLSCAYGSKSPTALRVALSGDSHAGEWLEGLRGVAAAKGWHLDTYLRSGCGLSSSPSPGIGADARCRTWNASVLAALKHGHYDLVIVSTRSSLVGGSAMSAANQATVAGSMSRAWTQLTTAGIRVIAIRDTPEPLGAGVADVPSCVADAKSPETTCSVAKSRALIADPQVAAVAETPGTQLIDMTRYFCPGATCPPIIGNVLVYADGHHITGLYSETLAGDLGKELTAALTGSARG
jgi:peptidoglycan/LPS O-acetylase OafA/YrhL